MGTRARRRHTALLLSHGDEKLSAATKRRYHAILKQQGLGLPTAEQEGRSGDAYARYRSGVYWLLERARPSARTSLLLDRNIAYAFRQNLLGLKPVALATLFCALLANGLLLLRSKPDEMLLWTDLALEAAFAGVLFVWIGGVSQAFVVDVSLCYAQRPLAQCETSGGKTKRNSARETAS